MKEKYSIILSEELSQKLFGGKNPVGETLFIDNKFNLTVTGILKKVPSNSHLQFDAIVPFDLVTEDGLKLNDWRTSTYYTYAVLGNGVGHEGVNKKIKDILSRHKSFFLFPEAKDSLKSIITSAYYKDKIEKIKKAAESQIKESISVLPYSLFKLFFETGSRKEY